MPAPDALPPVVCAVTTGADPASASSAPSATPPACSSPCTSSVASRMPDSLSWISSSTGPAAACICNRTSCSRTAPPRPRVDRRTRTTWTTPSSRVRCPLGCPREAFRPLEASVATDEIVAGDEIFVGAGRRIRVASAPDGTADSHAPTEWRRGFVTTPPRDRAGITVRYSARTIPGWSGAPVVARERRAARDDDDPEPSRGAGRLLAVHRAGADGADGEGIAAREIARDVLETVATAGVRKAAAAGTSRRRWRSWRGRSGTRAARDVARRRRRRRRWRNDRSRRRRRWRG